MTGAATHRPGKPENEPHWALVTGACSGIGREIAHELAARGYHLVLVSHRNQELVLAAKQIAQDHGLSTLPITLDLAQPEAARALHAKVRELGLWIEVLVSNAGVFFLVSSQTQTQCALT